MILTSNKFCIEWVQIFMLDRIVHHFYYI
ncbi:hypothetical protein [Bacillus sp. es.036]